MSKSHPFHVKGPAMDAIRFHVNIPDGKTINFKLPGPIEPCVAEIIILIPSNDGKTESKLGSPATSASSSHSKKEESFRKESNLGVMESTQKKNINGDRSAFSEVLPPNSWSPDIIVKAPASLFIIITSILRLGKFDQQKQEYSWSGSHAGLASVCGLSGESTVRNAISIGEELGVLKKESVAGHYGFVITVPVYPNPKH